MWLGFVIVLVGSVFFVVVVFSVASIEVSILVSHRSTFEFHRSRVRPRSKVE